MREMLLGLILAISCLQGIYANEINENYEDLQEALAMVLDTAKIESESLGRNYAYAQETVCFQEIGCFPKKDGPFSFIDLDPESPEYMQTKFLLFSRHNQKEPVKLSYLDKNTLTTTLYQPDKPLFVISHGFNEDSSKDWMHKMKNLFLAQHDCNVILVEWGKGALLPYYGQAMVNSEVVARELSVILTLLHETRGLVIENVHAVGFSLGAHLLGLVGKNLQAKLNRSLGRITGLDPAGPSFEDKDGKVHLSPNDAKFVDIVHTSAGKNILMFDFGIVKPIGNVDFYPNGGRDQPGCYFWSVACSHRRSVELFIESLEKECVFHAYPCDGGLTAFREGKCQDDCESRVCGVLGYSSIKAQGRGSLYLKTNNDVPYCLAQGK